jgi:membrane protein implicated in regulation of membrane protease activity
VILAHYVWWIAAVALAGVEVMTGTFYVLMVAIGCVAGGIAALFGLELTAQTLITIIVGIISVTVWHRYRRRHHPHPKDSAKNPDLHLDIGATIEVDRWVEGHARVNYRGSQWDAVPESATQPATGKLIVRAVRGSTLVLGPQHSAS